jgi:pyroglutamyl-peptidase
MTAVVPAKAGIHTLQHLSSAEAYGPRVSLRSPGATERGAMITILITGFGPFPGAPFNPTTPLVRHLARLRRPALRNVRVIGHVFQTSYAAVDRELPELIARHRPDALLMFGVATRRKGLSVEMRARNALALLPDASGNVLARRTIAPGASDLRMPAPHVKLLHATRSAHVPAQLSHDAGRYLCNYVCWHGASSLKAGGPCLAAFIHVPQLRRTPRRIRMGPRQLTAADLARAGEAILIAMAATARR